MASVHPTVKSFAARRRMTVFKLWNSYTGLCIRSWKFGIRSMQSDPSLSPEVCDILFSNDGMLIFCSSGNCSIKVWNVLTGLIHRIYDFISVLLHSSLTGIARNTNGVLRPYRARWNMHLLVLDLVYLIPLSLTMSYTYTTNTFTLHTFVYGN
jgi:hypothetical protein